MTWISLSNLPLWYEETGEGVPLLLLHGLGSSGADWALQWAALGGRYRVLAPDLRGHGRTPLPRANRAFLTIEHMAADIEALLDRLPARPAHVLGLSMGGCVALRLALSRPDCVRSLILVNTGALIRPSGRRFLRGLRRVVAFSMRGSSAMARVVADGLFPDPDQATLRAEAYARLSQASPQAYRAAILAILRFDARRQLPEIRCPTLVIAGAQDATIGPQPPRFLAAQIPNARLVVIPHSRHVTPVDQAEAFNRTVLEFLATVNVC